MARRQALLMLGGFYHDFAGYAENMTPLFETCGYDVRETYEMDDLLALDSSTDLVISYTSFLAHREGMNDTFPEGLTEAQASALTTWVEAGGGLLGVHAATVWGRLESATQKTLFGARFVEHPPQFSFAVTPLLPEHPITAGVPEFSVWDEFYMQELEPPFDVHMVALDRGLAYPVVWSKTVGQGRMVYLSPGHSAKIWDLPPYRQLTQQAIAWLER